jgi:lysozyme family protein
VTIAAIIDGVIGREGRYSNHPADRGGPTMWGITERVARRNGFTGDMRNLPRAKAVDIYTREYVINPGFDKIEAISPAVAEELVDTGVNMGPDVPSRWLQEWLNALNDQGRLYPDIKEDGDLGPATRNALTLLIQRRGDAGDKSLLKGLNCSQGERYKQLARGRVQNEAFVFGWLRTRVGL